MIRWCAGVLFVLVLLSARAADVNTTFAAGNQAYEQGKFAEAAALYRAAITNGAATSGAWFNLGNAEFKVGNLGRAIAAYRTAEFATPRDAALRANLAFVRKKASGDHPQPGAISSGLRLLTANEWATAASAALAAFFAVLAIAEWRGVRGSRTSLVCLAAVCLLLVGVAATSFYETYMSRHGVVVAKQIAVRFGPLDDSQSAFQLSDGAEVDLLDATPEWWQVRDRQGRVGWARRADIAAVSP